MKKQRINYETLLKVTKAISHSKDPEEVALMTPTRHVPHPREEAGFK